MPPKRTDTAVARDTLPSTTLIPASAVLRRFLTRLPKSVLVDLVLLWLDNPLSPIHEPDDADDSFFDEEPDQSIEHRREIYEAYKQDNGFSKNAVIDRIFTKEWRRGLNVFQVATLDMQFLFTHPTAQKWLSSGLHFANPPAQGSVQARPMPSLRPSLLVQQLRKSLNPLMRNHIFIQSHPELPLLVIRLVLSDNAAKDDLLSPRRTFFLGIPSSSPYIFHTPAADQLQEIIRQTLSQVFSTPRFPIVVAPTSPAISAKTLESMMTLCGATREASSLGAWRIYAKGWVDGSPLAPEKIMEEESLLTDERGRRENLARARFGMKPKTRNLLAVVEDDEEATDDIVGPALERVEWKITHDYPDERQEREVFAPTITMRLEGANVFHGVFEGIVEGWIDGDRIPGWLTGEEGRSEGKVRDGRIVDM